MLRNHYQIRLHGYDPSEGHEIIYKSIYDKENTINLLKELYDNHQLPSLEGNWTIEKNEEKPTWHYVLDVDQQPFLLEEYDDANAMIQAALQGLKESARHTIDDDGNQQDMPGKTYLFEQYVGNEVSLNYWIQKTINTLEIPELDNWKQLTVPKDLQT